MKKKIVLSLLLLTLVCTAPGFKSSAQEIDFTTGDRMLICRTEDAIVYGNSDLSNAIERVHANDLLVKIDETESVYRVQTPGGKIGYMIKPDVVSPKHVDSYLNKHIDEFTVHSETAKRKKLYKTEADLKNITGDEYDLTWSDDYKLKLYTKEEHEEFHEIYFNKGTGLTGYMAALASNALIGSLTDTEYDFMESDKKLKDGKTYHFKDNDDEYLRVKVGKKNYFAKKTSLDKLKKKIKPIYVAEKGCTLDFVSLSDDAICVSTEVDKDKDQNEIITGYTPVSNIIFTIESSRTDAIYECEQDVLLKKYTHSAVYGDSTIRNNLVNNAIKHLGGKYVWGGTSYETGTDCSGFMYLLYKAAGLTIGRNTKQQQVDGIGSFITREDVKYGDLIYYSINGITPSHVVMYLGNGECIEAKGSKHGICIGTVAWDRVLSIKDYAAVLESPAEPEPTEEPQSTEKAKKAKKTKIVKKTKKIKEVKKTEDIEDIEDIDDIEEDLEVTEEVEGAQLPMETVETMVSVE